jgi:hypothetical protein
MPYQLASLLVIQGANAELGNSRFELDSEFICDFVRHLIDPVIVRFTQFYLK